MKAYLQRAISKMKSKSYTVTKVNFYNNEKFNYYKKKYFEQD